MIPVAQRLGAAVPGMRVTPRGLAEAEIGHFGEGPAFDKILRNLAQRSTAAG